MQLQSDEAALESENKALKEQLVGLQKDKRVLEQDRRDIHNKWRVPYMQNEERLLHLSEDVADSRDSTLKGKLKRYTPAKRPFEEEALASASPPRVTRQRSASPPRRKPEEQA